MFFFLLIVVLFMFAFGVSTQSLMYHNQALNVNILKNIFFPSFFVIAGEYYTRDTIMAGKRSFTLTPASAGLCD